MTQVQLGGQHIVQTDVLGRKLTSFYVTGHTVYMTVADDAHNTPIGGFTFTLNVEDQAALLALLCDAARARQDENVIGRVI